MGNDVYISVSHKIHSKKLGGNVLILNKDCVAWCN